MKKIFKNDIYKKSRGSYSRLLQISCATCGTFVCHYQKDGPGILKRMYLDRISDSEKYSGLEKSPLIGLLQFTCPNCSDILGAPINYKRENRSAYRLFVGSVVKKIVKAT